jgi:hypothetical protein
MMRNMRVEGKVSSCNDIAGAAEAAPTKNPPVGGFFRLAEAVS